MSADCRLYLVTPVIADAQAFAPLLAQACKAGDVAAVLLRLAEADERTTVNRIKALAPTAQEAGAALVAAASPQAAMRGGADGVHLSGADLAAIRVATGTLQLERIVGAGGLASKHDAMTAGEAGVDYVLFGEPRADGAIPAIDTVIEATAWWAEVFAVPCVAFSPTFEAIADLAATGAEFIALGDAVWAHSDGPAEAVRRALDAIASAEVATR